MWHKRETTTPFMALTWILSVYCLSAFYLSPKCTLIWLQQHVKEYNVCQTASTSYYEMMSLNEHTHTLVIVRACTVYYVVHKITSSSEENTLICIKFHTVECAYIHIIIDYVAEKLEPWSKVNQIYKNRPVNYTALNR